MLTADLWPANSLSAWQNEPTAAFSEWLARQAVVANQLRESSCETYSSMFHTWLVFLTSRRMHLLEASAAEASEFFSKHKSLVPVSRRRYLQLLDRVYVHLGTLGWERDNPLSVELAKERELEIALPPGLTDEEQAALLAVLEYMPSWKGARDRALIALLLGAGLRANEVVGLTTDKMRPDYSIRVIPATVHAEHVTLMLPDGRWREWYESWLTERRRLEIAGEWVTPATLSGRPYSPSGLFRRTSTWFDAANLNPKQRGPHILRNTFGRNALACGRYSLEEVQQFLGHAELRATARYGQSRRISKDPQV
ncbi:MAG TPA: site-specific integrase [Aromatoleum sp.]|uniref:tyrosine-type recombinase/integrase n=1 Tax=Aromatoleum sp. TaxID=2307007 RepID=UPI002B46E431|nr:site-specific integrase [Aromatoleum sp.]HJV26011.1 site-specific integrase [Aromatoleum sp.]